MSHKVPRLPRETKLREAGKLPKMSPFADLTRGTAIPTSHTHTHLPTVADGCERLRTVAKRLRNGCATSGEHTLNPHTPRVKRGPLLRIREKGMGKWNEHPPFIGNCPMKIKDLQTYFGDFPASLVGGFKPSEKI